MKRFLQPSCNDGTHNTTTGDYSARKRGRYRGAFDNKQKKTGGASQSATSPQSVAALTGLMSTAQIRVLTDFVRDKKNVFCTGRAGTGKSHLLKVIRAVIPGIAFTTPTGTAAVNIGGSTIHSWSGVCGMSDRDLPIILATVKRNKAAMKRWREATHLVIDEISMIAGDFLDKLDKVGRFARGDHRRPFGGLQVLFLGDFFQLAPVKPSDPNNCYAFQSAVWREMFGYVDIYVDNSGRAGDDENGGEENGDDENGGEERDVNDDGDNVPSRAGSTADNNAVVVGTGCAGSIVELDYMFRQSDPVFVRILDEFRTGEISPETDEFLKSISLDTNILHSANTGAATGATAGAHCNDQRTVLFSKNFDCDRYNRMMYNKLTAASATSANAVTYRAEDSGKKKERLENLTNVPVEIELKVGTYVMLTKNVDVAAGLVNGSIGTIVYFDTSIDGEHVDYEVPYVRFNNRKRVVPIEKEIWTVEENDVSVASRIQIPLIYAWGISMHKSQGMTIKHLDLSFRDIFTTGQAYVALSRATDLENLRIFGYNRGCVTADHTVKKFYAGLPKPAQPSVLEEVPPLTHMSTTSINSVDLQGSRSSAALQALREPGDAGDDDRDDDDRDGDDREVISFDKYIFQE